MIGLSCGSVHGATRPLSPVRGRLCFVVWRWIHQVFQWSLEVFDSHTFLEWLDLSVGDRFYSVEHRQFVFLKQRDEAHLVV